MNSRSTRPYLLHKFTPLTHIVLNENVQPRVYTFEQKGKLQISHQTQQDICKSINDSPLTHPSVNSAKTIGIKEDSKLKLACN